MSQQERRDTLKRKFHPPDVHQSKRLRENNSLFNAIDKEKLNAGKILKVYLRNFMCHESMEIILNPNVNFIVGQNGSGKSAILTALTVGLGARAVITNRGNSMKEFIKKGKTSALIEITLSNVGLNMFKNDLYGNAITICRSIGTSSNYKIKNYMGEVISTKKTELEQILSTMNIQVENPVCVMNQDVSRSFLVMSTPAKKYEFFMKATRLDVINTDYKNSEMNCEESEKRLRIAQEYLADIKKQVDELETNIKALESVETAREEHSHLLIEFQWAKVIEEEIKYQEIEKTLKENETRVHELLSIEETKDVKEKKINADIQILEEQLKQVVSEVSDNKAMYDKTKNEYYSTKELYNTKLKELQQSRNIIKRTKHDIVELQREVEKNESGTNQVENEQQQMQENLNRLELTLDDVQAVLRTKQTDKMHYEGDKIRLEQERHSTKITLENCHLKIRQLKQQLTGLQQQMDNAITVYGQNMPRLVRRIDEEYQRGRFQQKPRGPLGAYIKVKERAWIPAIENHLGNLLSSFCVDNSKDAKHLSVLMKEIFHDEKKPQIISSKFFNWVHNVSSQRTYSQKHYTLLDMMEISDPVVTNCLIDQREIECVLLIPSSKEACEIMSEVRKVPPNCKRAITQNADLFYPDPNYKTYGGKPGLRAKFLQVSPKEAIQGLQEELETVNKEKDIAEKVYMSVVERTKIATKELDNIQKQVSDLMTSQHKIQSSIDQLKDKLGESLPLNLNFYATELTECKKKLKMEEEHEKSLSVEIEQLKESLNNLNVDVKRTRDLVQHCENRLSSIQNQIQLLKDEKESLHFNTRKSSKTLEVARGTLQKTTAELEVQKRQLDKLMAAAQKCGNRINTNRSSADILRQTEELHAQIIATEQQYGSIDELREELKERKFKYNDIICIANKIEENNKKQSERLALRKKLYNTCKKQIGYKVQRAFESILSLRKYTGSIEIDHKNRLLELQVYPQNDEKRMINNARSLSGGERSFSTVAFILALWDCTGLPFYFLDEFDVFMDKVNRRIIMDILMDHTKLHPQSQFAFLTPLDTSHVFAEDYVTIHQLEPPERTGQSE